MRNGQRLAIPLEGMDAVVAWHNVAGAGGVLNAAGDSLEQRLESHYAPRGIDHIPYISGNIACYVQTPSPERLHAHAAYRQQLAHMPFIPIANLQDLRGMGVKNALFLPYIRLFDDPLPEGINWRRYGLPPTMTLYMKDKAFMHNWMMENGFAIHTPNHITCHATYIPYLGAQMIAQIEQMLIDLDMRGHYPLGLMIRGALSDGNYAMAAIVEAQESEVVSGRWVEKGQWMLKPNGKAADMEIFDNLYDTLARVRDHIQNENNPELDDRVVMSRLLDVEVSPGLSAAVIGGDVYTFPFNGQYMAAGDTACTGTWTFAAAVGESYSARISGSYLEQSQTLLRRILEKFLRNADTTALYAMLNMDMMVVGALERELWQRAVHSPEHRYYTSDTGYYNELFKPHVYNPAVALFAEINPRDTNWTIAMKAVLQVLNLPCTLENLAMLAQGQRVQVLARDHWKLPEGMAVEQARALLLDFHQNVLPTGDGFILRMSNNPAGVITYAHTQDPARVEQITQEAYDYLLAHLPQPV